MKTIPHFFLWKVYKIIFCRIMLDKLLNLFLVIFCEYICTLYVYTKKEINIKNLKQ